MKSFFRLQFYLLKNEFEEQLPCVLAVLLSEMSSCLLCFYFTRLALSSWAIVDDSVENKTAFFVPMAIFGGLTLLFVLAAFVFENHLAKKNFKRWMVLRKLGVNNSLLTLSFFVSLVLLSVISFLLAYGIDSLICIINDAPMPSEEQLLGAFPSPKIVLLTFGFSLAFSFVVAIYKTIRLYHLTWRSKR